MRHESGLIARMLDLLMQVAIAAILIVVFLLVVLRYVFHTTIIGGNEATLIAFVFASVFAATLSLRDDEHIAVRYFTDAWSSDKQRVATVVRWLLLAVLHLVLLVYSMIWIAKTGRFIMPAIGLPQWLAQISIPIGSALGLYYSASRCRQSISQLADREDQEC